MSRGEKGGGGQIFKKKERKERTSEVKVRPEIMNPLVYYESINRELQTRPIYECRCDERLKTKAEESTRLTSTGFHGELEHLKIKTRLIDEMFANVKNIILTNSLCNLPDVLAIA